MLTSFLEVAVARVQRVQVRRSRFCPSAFIVFRPVLLAQLDSSLPVRLKSLVDFPRSEFLLKLSDKAVRRERPPGEGEQGFLFRQKALPSSSLVVLVSVRFHRIYQCVMWSPLQKFEWLRISPFSPLQ